MLTVGKTGFFNGAIYSRVLNLPSVLGGRGLENALNCVDDRYRNPAINN